MKFTFAFIIFAILVADAAMGEPTQEPMSGDNGKEENTFTDSLLEKERQHPDNELELQQPQVVNPPPSETLLDKYIIDQIDQLNLDENITDQLKHDPEYRELIKENASRKLNLDKSILYKLKHDPKYRKQIEDAEREWYQSLMRVTPVILFLVLLLLGIIFLARRHLRSSWVTS